MKFDATRVTTSLQQITKNVIDLSRESLAELPPPVLESIIRQQTNVTQMKKTRNIALDLLLSVAFFEIVKSALVVLD
jgi:hypothetical protein